MPAPEVKTTQQLRAHLRARHVPLAVVKELVRRVFQDCDSVSLGLLSKGGFSSAVLLDARARTRADGLPIQPQALKVGRRETIREEARRFRRYVKNVLRGVPSQTRQLAFYNTWAVLPYWHIASGPELRTLGELYNEEDAETIVAVCRTLFDQVMAPWLRNLRSAERYIFQNSTHCYGIPESTLAQIQRNAKLLHLPDPLTAWRELKARNRLPALVYEPVIHGDLNSGNVLIDKAFRPWVIDFRHTGPGHYLRDVAKLEAEIKFLLMDPQGDATRVPSWLHLDRALDDSWGFGQSPPPTFPSMYDAELVKAFISICGVRALARDRMPGPKPPQIAQYRAALLHFTLRVVTYRDVSPAKKAYAIHSALRLCHFNYDFSGAVTGV